MNIVDALNKVLAMAEQNLIDENETDEDLLEELDQQYAAIEAVTELKDTIDGVYE